jgi:RNA:NAD 2'-phosphotransferase (TPT1/KptA family)
MKNNSSEDLLLSFSQGHSIKNLDETKILKPITNPNEFPLIVHGTYMKFWPSIKAEGLKTMTRNHIHFATGFPKDQSVISGMRMSCEVFIEIDLQTAIADGLKFFLSTNGVVLSSGRDGVIGVEYFKNVTDKKGGKLS